MHLTATLMNLDISVGAYGRFGGKMYSQYAAKNVSTTSIFIIQPMITRGSVTWFLYSA